MSESLLQVKRDEKTSALINTSDELWRKRQHAKNEKKRLDQLEEKVDLILELLKQK